MEGLFHTTPIPSEDKLALWCMHQPSMGRASINQLKGSQYILGKIKIYEKIFIYNTLQ